MLSELESFKAGFLTRCVEEDTSTEEALSRIKTASDQLDALEKQAGIIDSLSKLVGGVVSPAVEKIINYGSAAAIFGPPILGGAAGYGVSRLTDVDEEDVDDIKKQELIDEYKRQADKLRQSKALRMYRNSRKSRGGVYL